MGAIAEDNLKMEIASLEERCNRLKSLLESETAIRRINVEKANRADMLQEKLKHTSSEVSKVDVMYLMYPSYKCSLALVGRMPCNASTPVKRFKFADKIRVGRKIACGRQQSPERALAARQSIFTTGIPE